MKIENAKLFLGKTFVKGSVSFDEKILSIKKFEEKSEENTEGKSEGNTEKKSGAQATQAQEEIIDAEGGYLIPGLIDVHTHAAMGADASDGDLDGLARMAEYYAKGGVTTFFPTTLTLPEDQLTKAILTAKELREKTSNRSTNQISGQEASQEPKKSASLAKIGGIHLEGPFINMEKRGAQNPDYIREPDIDFFNRLVDCGEGLVKFITVAPEVNGAIDFIREASKSCCVSLGHTNCDYDTAIKGFEAGATHLTHLYNAMPSLLHRAPGLIAAGVDFGAEAEIITDGIHSHPAMVRLAHKLFGENLILISDSIRCAGMPDGDYELGGLQFTLKDGKATITGTDTIAGSAIHLMDGVRRAAKFGIPLEDAVYAASTRAAISAKLDDELGSIQEGLSADMVLLDKDLNVKAVFINGKKIQA